MRIKRRKLRRAPSPAPSDTSVCNITRPEASACLRDMHLIRENDFEPVKATPSSLFEAPPLAPDGLNYVQNKESEFIGKT